jgi:adenylate cyclase
MLGFRGNKTTRHRATVSVDFRHALMQQVLRTEPTRIKALIATTAVLAAMLFTFYILNPRPA